MLKTFVKKYPASVTVIPFALGIVISYYSGMNLSALPYAFFLAALIIFAAVIIYVYQTISRGELFLFSYAALLILFGIFSFQFRYYKIDDNDISRATELYKDKKSILYGTISDKPEVKDSRVRLLIESQSVNGNSCRGLVLVTVYRNQYQGEELGSLRYGDVVTIEGKLEKLPHRRNPGEFDYGEYLKLHNIAAVFIASGYEQIELKGHNEPSFYTANIVIPVRDYSIKVIDEYVGGDEGEYLKGLVLGERSNISREIKENFVNAGVAHIIAVSGLNVAYVILIIYGLLLLIPIKHSYKNFITIFFLIFYMTLTGNTPSIVRATIMASIFLIAQIIERKPNPFNIVSFAALVILVIDPRQLFDAGFILSFSAILSIIIIYPKLEKLMNTMKWYRGLENDKAWDKTAKWIIALFLGTLTAQIGTLPITAIMFKKISIISLAANLFAIPLSNIALALGFVMIIISTFSVWLASVFASLNSFLLFIQLILIEVCAKLDYAYVETYFVDRMLFVFYYIGLILVLTITKKNYAGRLAMVVLLAGNFVMWKSTADTTDKAQLTFMNVGNSNSTLIQMPEGTSILINTGSSTDNYTSAERNVLPYIKTQGINKVDLLILNTLNFNEFRNLKFMVENFPVKKILVPEYYKPVFENSAAISLFKNTVVEFIDSSQIINKQGNFRLYLYYVKGCVSMLTQLTYGEQSYVFSDSDGKGEDYSAFINDYEYIKILKAAGSGSFEFTSPEFISKVNPELVVISQSKQPRKKLNGEVFRETLTNFGMDVITNENGALIFETDGYTTQMVKW